jgi:hypothetical protein
MNAKLSEYHTGYRAFTREVLEAVNYNANSDNFVFDNQMLAQIWYAGYEIAEITCPNQIFRRCIEHQLEKQHNLWYWCTKNIDSISFTKMGNC